MKASLVFLLVVASLLPGAAADAEIEGPVVVRVDDQRPADCTPTAVEACLVKAPQTRSLGDETVDLHSSVRRIDVAANPAHVARAAGFLPVYAMTLEGNSSYVSFALVETAIDLYATVPQDRPARDALGLQFDREAVAVYYYGPSRKEEGLGNRSLGMSLENDDGGWVAYDGLGPMNSGAVTSTDIQAGPLPLMVCDFADRSQGCYNTTLAMQERYNQTTPNVIVGFEWDAVTLATDPSALPPDVAAVTNETTPEPQTAPRRDDSLALWARPGPRDGGRTPDVPAELATPGLVQGPPVPPPASLDVAIAGAPEAPPTPLPTILAIGAGLGLSLVVSALYSRFASKHALLAHPVRAAVMAQVAARPGTSSLALQKTLNLNRSTLLYHLRLLEREGCVRLASVNQSLRVHLPGQAPAGRVEPELEHPTRGQVLSALVSAPRGLTRAELHAALPSMPLRTRNHTIARLKALGLIRAEPIGRETRFTLVHAPVSTQEGGLRAH